MGELGFEEYSKSPLKGAYWAFFFCSVIFLQIIMLNLLIAIMGNTYS